MIQYTLLALFVLVLLGITIVLLLRSKKGSFPLQIKNQMVEIPEIEKYRASIDALLENSTDLIWSIDKNLCLISFNNSFYESYYKRFLWGHPTRSHPKYH